MKNAVLNLDAIKLSSGGHGGGGKWCGEQCAVELSNLIAARKVLCPPELAPACPLEPAPFGDDHPSISRVIRAYVIGLNDAWDDEQRQKLVPYAARILCTATGIEDDEVRAWMATDWLVRVHTPAFLRLAGLTEHAQALEGLARIADATLARAAQPTIDAAKKGAAAAWAAAGAAARDAAWDAAGAAAWDAARAAAGAAARAAAGDAAGDAAWDAAWAAARAAAWDAAWAAAGDAAWAAAGAAAGAALRPTVVALQESSLVLLDAMIAVGKTT
jgi:hypothetical protein